MVFLILWPLVTAILATLFLPFVYNFRHRIIDAWNVYYVAIVIAAVGITMLFFARLPLYRQRKFLTFGPKELDARHRKLYWVAYCSIGISVYLLLRLAFAVGAYSALH